MTVVAEPAADGGRLTCPECRDDGRRSELAVASVTHNAWSISTGVTFACPQCGWAERYEL